jgi:hypothetical protein
MQGFISAENASIALLSSRDVEIVAIDVFMARNQVTVPRGSLPALYNPSVKFAIAHGSADGQSLNARTQVGTPFLPILQELCIPLVWTTGSKHTVAISIYRAFLA